MDSYGNYISGTYRQKYYKTFNRGGQMYGLEILEKGYEGASKEIGDLQAVRLTIEGDQGGIDSPIVKTSLSFTMADTWDEPDTETVKHGNWQEFYTPDSTKFLVRLGIASGPHFGGGFIWSGYITPDSWQESLSYRDSITITARDNIGHLQDFEFDLAPDGDGLVKVRDIITGAMAKVNLPMDFYINADQQDYSHGIYYDGVNIVDSFIPAAHFDGEDWASALEDVLNSLGFVLRFCFYNKVSVGPIRNISHLATTEGALPANDKEVIFLGGGTRSIDPPYRSIKEELKYDYEDSPAVNADKGLDGFYQYGTVPSTVYWIQGSGGTGSGVQNTFNSPVGYNNNNSNNIGWRSDPNIASYTPGLYGKDLLPYDESEWEETEENILDDSVLLLANTDNYIGSVFSMRVASTDITLKFGFARRCATINNEGTYFVPAPRRLLSIRYVIYYSKNNVMRYWDGEDWDTSSHELVFDDIDPAAGTIDLEIPLVDCPDVGPEGLLYVNFLFLGTAQLYKYYGGGIAPPTINSLYVRLKSFEFSSNNDHVESDTVTTINDESYNVRFKRSPEIGPLSYDIGRVIPDNYQNVLYYRSGDTVLPYGYRLNWGGEQGSKPFPALVHMQLLVNHLVPMQVLEGDCMVEGEIWPGGVYKYKGKRFLLLSGTYDFVTGRMQGVVLREFKEYSDVWPRGSAGPATDSKSKTRR